MANSNNNPQSVIPDVMYDVEGNFVTVPVPEGADAGKVLGAISEGTVGWVEDQGAGVIQQQSDWTETDDTKVTFIQHKPANLVQDAAYVHTDNNFTDADSTKLAGIAAGAEVNVQSNWNESDSSSDAFIANKPTQKPVVAGANISIVDGQDAVTISATVPTVDQTYNASSANAQSGVAVAEAVGAVASVPSVTSSDDGKVLKASYDSVAGTGSFSWETQTTPTVDQTYNSSSANAQSGVAVAGALAGVNQVPASTSADANKVLTVDSQGIPGWVTPSGGGGSSDEWWGGEPEKIELSRKQIRLLFRDPTYDPRNDSDTTFLNRFDSITKEADGSYTFQFKKSTSSTKYARSAFNGKYLTDNEFVVLAWNTRLLAGEYVYNESYDYMFYNCTGLCAVYNVLVAQGQKTNCQCAFYECTNLVTYREYSDNLGNRLNFYIENGQAMFQGCTSLKDVFMLLAPAEQIGGVTSSMDYTNMFNGCTKLECGPLIYGPAVSCSNMFRNCVRLREFSNFLLSPIDTEASSRYVAQNCDCSGMFYNCAKLTDLSRLCNFFSRVNISNANDMFAYCRLLQEIPFHLNLSSSGCSTAEMFMNDISISKLPDMDYDRVTNASKMFQECTILSNISSLSSVTWNSSLTTVDYMFDCCYSIQRGLKDTYDNMAATATITSHSNTFRYSGYAFSNQDLYLIPSAWGGEGS